MRRVGRERKRGKGFSPRELLPAVEGIGQPHEDGPGQGAQARRRRQRRRSRRGGRGDEE